MNHGTDGGLVLIKLVRMAWQRMKSECFLIDDFGVVAESGLLQRS